MSLNRGEKDKQHSLKGSLLSVLLLGGFIALSWLGVYMLFINR